MTKNAGLTPIFLTQTRARVLRQIAESNEVYQKYYNQAFVVMQYFGYLRRDPDILHLDCLFKFRGQASDLCDSPSPPQRVLLIMKALRPMMIRNDKKRRPDPDLPHHS